MRALHTDENVDVRIVRGLRRHLPGLEITSVENIGLRETDDRIILDWAAAHDTTLVTHDVQTMVGYANERIRDGRPMSGVVMIRWGLPIGVAVEDLETLLVCLADDEWESFVRYLPL